MKAVFGAPSLVLCMGLVLLLASHCSDTNDADTQNSDPGFQFQDDPGPQLSALKDPPSQERFQITDRVWPQQAGEAVVCLWADDKIAAVSLTVDDNVVPEHDWWIEQMQKHGFKMTWFIIVNRVTGNPSFSGPWSAFLRLSELGNDIQSHTMNHIDIATNPISDSALDYEYGAAVQSINSQLPGQRCLAIAYPYCRGNMNIAVRHYISGRGCDVVSNKANAIHYMETNAGLISPAWIDQMLTLTPGAYARRWRSWSVVMYHKVGKGNTPEEKQAAFQAVASDLDYMFSKKDQLWIDTYTAVAMYGEERDTHILRVLKNTQDVIALHVKDSMSDAIFNYPLTVKVRLHESWGTSILAWQGTRSLEPTIIQYDGVNYALVKAIPDQGAIVLRPKTPARMTNSNPTSILSVVKSYLFTLFQKKKTTDADSPSGHSPTESERR